MMAREANGVTATLVEEPTQFTFDYRGFGRMQIVKGKVLLDDQVRDVVHAMAFVAGDLRMRDHPMVLLAWLAAQFGRERGVGWT